MGHGKFGTTYNIYAEAEQSLQQQTAETIDELITYLAYEGNSEDMERLFKEVQDLDLNTLEEKKCKVLKQELIRLASIPKLEEEVREIILSMSKIEQATIKDYRGINYDNVNRLNLIYSLLGTLELFKTQTKEMKKNKEYSKKYKHTVEYIETTQKLLRLIHNASENEPTKEQATIRTFAVNY